MNEEHLEKALDKLCKELADVCKCCPISCCRDFEINCEQLCSERTRDELWLCWKDWALKND